MSSTQAAQHAPTPSGAPRRVREQARDAATVMAFSLATSLGGALALALLSGLGR